MNFSLQYPGEPKGSHGSKRSLILFTLGILIIAVIFYLTGGIILLFILVASFKTHKLILI